MKSRNNRFVSQKIMHLILVKIKKPEYVNIKLNVVILPETDPHYLGFSGHI